MPDDWLDDVTVVGNASSLAPHAYPQGLTARELSHALRGEMLNHFLLQEFIGGGGMGVVFKALDTTLDRIVAVKVVASHRMDSEDLQRRFLIEAQSTARLDHPNIARIHFIGRDRGLPYIVFEYIDGVNIRDHVADQGPLAVEEAVSYAYQIAHALAHAWKRDVVHRDIKPSNILVTDDGEAKLVDMGLARLFDVEQEEDLTATGVTLGTFDYISPEQARDPREADCRSDIYSLGCTIFYMLAGRPPFADGTAVQKLLQHQADPPPALYEYRSDVPESVSALVRRMLEKAPENRQQSPVELVHDLAAILNELGVRLPHALTPMPLATPLRIRSRRRRHVVWAAPVAIALGAGFVMDRMTREQADGSPFEKLRGIDTSSATTAEPVEVSGANAPSPAAKTDNAVRPPLAKASDPRSNGEPLDGAGQSAATFDLGREGNLRDSFLQRFDSWPSGGDLATPVPSDSLLAEPLKGAGEVSPTGDQATPTNPRRPAARPGPPAPPAE